MKVVLASANRHKAPELSGCCPAGRWSRSRALPEETGETFARTPC